MAQSTGVRKSSKKSRSAKKGSKLAFLPEALQAFVARRLVDICAGLFFILGFVMFVALASYNHADPSWNTAQGAANPEAVLSSTNWAGAPGAWMSDLFLQTIGVPAFLIAAVLMIWGARVYKRQFISRFWLRIIALILLPLVGAVAVAQVPTNGWMVHPYWGSTFGSMMLEGLANALPLARFVISAVACVLSVAAFLYAAAFTRGEIRFALIALVGMSVSLLQFFYDCAVSFAEWVKHYNDPSFQTQRAPALEQFKDKVQRVSAHAKKNLAEDVAGLSEAMADPVDSAPFIADTKPAPLVPEPVASPVPQPAAAIPVVTPQGGAGKAGDMSAQKRFALSENENWEFPPLALLEDPPENGQTGMLDKAALQRNAELLQNVLADFGVQGEITSIYPGPVVTLYELEPAAGTKSARVISLSDDIARSMSAVSVRCAVVPGRNVIGIELPNKTRQIVYMQEVLASKEFTKTGAKLPLVLGKDIGGQPIIADLAKMPHLLVAGTTGSGKSVAVNTMILSILYNLPPEKCRFIMIDPKMLELSVYDDIPHLLSPVVTEPGKAVVSLKWAVNEMEERYRAMSKLGVRNINGYNERVAAARKKGEVIMNKVQTGFDPGTGEGIFEEVEMDLSDLPYIVIVVDEFADLMLVAGKDVESAIQRLAQMARAAGIHLIMATQRPSVDVITGVVKANFPTRISFQVTSKIDSRTILGEGGAEQLLGMGDMLYMAPGGRITRVHGPFVADEDVEKVVNHLKAQGEPSYLNEVTEGSGDFGDNEVMNAMFGGGAAGGDGSQVDELYDQAVAVVAREGKASTSFIQRYLQIGYNRAARIIEEMEKQGVVSPATATGKREVLITDHSGS